MSRFLGTHLVRLDAKGRVSVPAPFRASLRTVAEKAGTEPGGSLVLWPSHKFDCIDAWPGALFDELTTPLDRLDLFSPDQSDMASALFADAVQMDPDKEGRILLPEALVTHARLSEGVAFVGNGRTFMIWEPAAAEQRRQEARERARTLTLPAATA